MTQNDFLKKIEDILPANASLVNELSEILEISQDSAYRRIRGSTQLTIDEVTKLCRNFKISFDVFDEIDINSVTFSYLKLENKIESFNTYLEVMIKDLNLIRNAKQHKITYACEDIPIFYNYKYPLLGAFKIFYWMEAILNNNDSEGKKFSQNSIPEQLKNGGRQIFETYLEIPSIEIWTDTTYYSVIKQIEFFWESGRFENNELVINVLSELAQLLKDIQLQAEVGHKLIGSTSESGQKAYYELYFSEIEIGNNCVLVDLGNTKSVYLGHMSFSTISTLNKTYCNLSEQWLNNMIKKATPMSKVSEKLRYQFFRKAFTNIETLKQRVLHS
jgi:plasmid maintenance system antidote protein VapI